MTRNCTQNDLIRLLYGELEEDAYTGVLNEVESEELRLNQLAEQVLPKVSFAPSAASIKSILQFSERTAIAMHLN